DVYKRQPFLHAARYHDFSVRENAASRNYSPAPYLAFWAPNLLRIHAVRNRSRPKTKNVKSRKIWLPAI
ncbi:MAG: hypothetical protein E6Z15_16220, partial [Paenibacillus macerans]|nr:hypothetical protein [Paenibacillus macerans]